MLIIAWIALFLLCLFTWRVGPERSLLTIKVLFVFTITCLNSVVTFLVMHIFIGLAEMARNMQIKLLECAKKLYDEWKEEMKGNE